MKNKLAHYSLTDDDIRAYQKLSDKQKLTWLEESLEFTMKAMSSSGKKSIHSFHKGY